MPGKISLQFKFGLSYILVILAVLLLLNTYPLLVSQNLVFRTKQTAMVGSVKIAEAALSGLADLTEDNVAQAMSAVEETGVSRVLVTDTAGRILYDTREGDNARGLYAFYTEIAQALRGNDTFYCRYDGEAFLSRGASPVVYHNQIVGAVYAYEYDTVQAELLRSFQTNIMRISLLVALFVLFLSALLSRMFTRRISDLLQAIRQVREGAYSHRAKVTGSDEIAQLAAEFNSLTDRLQRMESARRQFVSDASHELKTPLATMKILLENIIYQPEMDAEMRTEFLTDINKEIDRLNSIISDLLTLVSMDSKAMRLNRTTFSLAQVITDTAHRLQPVAESHHQELKLALNDRCEMYADCAKLTQVVYNLMENAIKYTQEGGAIKVRLIRSGRDAVMTVTDNGPGIPREDQAHIFDRFYRVDKARSRETGGTGLGLSIVHQMVLMHGGSVSVESEEGRGSTFTVELPIHQG